MYQPKITDVSAIYLKAPHFRDRTDSSQDALIVSVTTDSGHVGYGEVDSSPTVTKAIINAPASHARARGLREILIGEPALDTGRLWNKMLESTLYYGRSGAVIQAMAGVDLALWDLKGKILDQPVYQLLGGKFRNEIKAYASHMFGMTPEETYATAARAAENGFTAVKFGWEPFGENERLDVKLTAAVRSAVGPDVQVMIDAGLAWDAKTAIQRARLIEPYDIFWLEEPLRPDDLDGYSRLADSVDMRIAAGEEESEIYGFERLITQGRIDVVQIDVTRVGLTEAMRIAAFAHDRGKLVANHNFGTDINTAASLHLLAAIPNALILEYCVESNVMRDNLVRNPIRLKNGSAAVPEEPGLGVQINWDEAEKYIVQ